MNTITTRPAKPSDARRAGIFLFQTFEKKATFIIGLGDKNRAVQILTAMFKVPGHRFSYEWTDMVLLKDQVVGLFTSFPGQMLGKLDRRLDRLILKQYRWRGKLAVILRGWPLVFVKETGRDEYYLSNLAIRKSFRGKGLGTQVIRRLEKKAGAAGLGKVSLIVAIENELARRFYERNGFKTVAIQLESNRRVPLLGPGFQRMVKTISGQDDG
jgi:ribosomal protein S18 acetylase RimI-like enzyme